MCKFDAPTGTGIVENSINTYSVDTWNSVLVRVQ